MKHQRRVTISILFLVQGRQATLTWKSSLVRIWPLLLPGPPRSYECWSRPTQPVCRARPSLAKSKFGQEWSPSLAKPSLAKTKFGQTKFGQDQVWPDQVWPRPSLARPSAGQYSPCFCEGVAGRRPATPSQTRLMSAFSFQRAFMWSIAGQRPAMLHMKVC